MHLNINLSELIERYNLDVKGDKVRKIQNLFPIDLAKEPDLTFYNQILTLNVLKGIKANCIITKGLSAENPEDILKDRSIILSDNPKLLFARIANDYYKEETSINQGISPRAEIEANNQISEDACIGPFCIIKKNCIIKARTKIYGNVFIGENCQIGSNCRIYPNVSIYSNTIIGDNVIIHSGTVIGSDGFGYVFDNEKHFKIQQSGRVVIKSDVEIGANVTIDRASFGETVIGKGVKIDNMVHIAHNVKIGDNTVIVAQVGISGSTEIGKYCVVAGQSGFAQHLKIGDNVKIAAKSGVTKNIESGKVVSGFPAQDHKLELKEKVLIKQLPKIIEKIKKIEKYINKEGK